MKDLDAALASSGKDRVFDSLCLGARLSAVSGGLRQETLVRPSGCRLALSRIQVEVSFGLLQSQSRPAGPHSVVKARMGASGKHAPD